MNGTNIPTATSTRRSARESLIQQMLREQSENKSVKDITYSSIFSTNQSPFDPKRRSSGNVGSESLPSQSNTPPIVTRRKRPDWAEPTVSVDQAAVLKASLERKAKEAAIKDKISYNMHGKIEKNSTTDSNSSYPSSPKNSNNNYNDHFQKVSTITSRSATSKSTASSVAEQNLNAKMSFLNNTPINGAMTGNGEASSLARHTKSSVNTTESILNTSTSKRTATTTASATSEEENNISTNSAISPNNNGMVNEHSTSETTTTKHISTTTSGEPTAEPCV